jgi:hypothetical protein
MRARAWTATAVLGVTAVAVAVPSDARSAVRVVQVAYASATATTSNPPVSWLSANASARERVVTVAAVDDHTARVAMWVRATRPRSATGTSTLVCPDDSGRFSIRAGTTVYVAPASGMCRGTLSAPTSGTVTLRFARTVAKEPRVTAPEPPRHVVPPRDRWALLIGISDYAGNTHSTVGGRGDALLIRRVLLHNGWRRDHIRMLLDARATADRIVAGMRWLARRSAPTHFTLFHYSGHTCIASRGPCPSGHYYLWSHDNRMLSEQVVGSLLRELRGRAWIDYMGCEAAGVVSGLATANRLVTASSRADEKSYEYSRWHESVWSRLVWRRGFHRGAADHNHNGRVGIREAVGWARRMAPQITAHQDSFGPQHPQVRGGAGGGWRLDGPTLPS